MPMKQRPVRKASISMISPDAMRRSNSRVRNSMYGRRISWKRTVETSPLSRELLNMSRIRPGSSRVSVMMWLETAIKASRMVPLPARSER